MKYLSSKKLGLRTSNFGQRVKKKQSNPGVETTLPRLNKEIKGLSGLVGIVGEPKVCKSSFVLDICTFNALNKKIPALIYDKENGAERTLRRALCQLTNRPWDVLQGKTIEQLDKYCKRLGELPLYYENKDLSYDTMCAYVQEMRDAHNTEQGILVIDPLYGLPLDADNLRISIDKWLENLDELKQEHDNYLTILLVLDKRRGAYGEAVKSAGKDSGRIEYKLEQQIDLRTNAQNDIILAVTENRDGPAGFEITLQKQLANISDKRSFVHRLEEKVGL